MGPLSGLVVAPLVGVLSDRCTLSFGRRRPFLLGGLIGCVIGMNVFANASRLTFDNLFVARFVAIMAFGILDFSTNAIMFPSRALLGDLLPAAQQHEAQSAAAVVASLAEICAGAYLSSWKDPVTSIGRIFVTASVFLLVSCAVSLIVCVEQPLVPDSTTSFSTSPSHDRAIPHSLKSNTESGSDENVTNIEEDDNYDTGDDHRSEKTPSINTNSSNCDPSVSSASVNNPPLRVELSQTISKAISEFPRPLIRVGIVYGLAWFCWFSSLPFYSQWLGTDVLNGDPHAEAGTAESLAYQRGVSIFSMANVAKAVFAMIFGAFYPSILRFIGAVGERIVFGLSFLVFSCVLYACANTKDVLVAAGVIALGSVPFIVTQTIPIAIVVQKYPENLASNLGVLYVKQFFFTINSQ